MIQQPLPYDIAIIGAGPAGLQAALMLARTRKRVVIFDAPEPPRNAASHGVHNFVGLDGMLPAEIRELAWQQISVYGSSTMIRERVTDIRFHNADNFVVYTANKTVVIANHVILAMGFEDIYPDVPGFHACWGKTIIPCPFCDGYENRDRVWGLVVSSASALEHMPKLYKNWTHTARLIILPQVTISEESRSAYIQQGITVHCGEILAIEHAGADIEAVVLSGGERVEVETLWWRPEDRPLPLTQAVIKTFDLELDHLGHIKTDTNYQTQVKGLWAIGDVQGWAGALGAAYAAHSAATAIIREWYE